MTKTVAIADAKNISNNRPVSMLRTRRTGLRIGGHTTNIHRHSIASLALLRSVIRWNYIAAPAETATDASEPKDYPTTDTDVDAGGAYYAGMADESGYTPDPEDDDDKPSPLAPGV